MSEHWEYFPFQSNGKVGTVVYDHGISETIDQLPVDQSVRIVLRFQSPLENGTPVESERVMADALENEIESIVVERSGIYTGRITIDDHRYFYTYLDADEDVISAIVAELADQHKCELTFDTREDLEREDYWQQLFPTPDTWQYIQNMKVVAALEQSGDDLTQARRIDHWASFDAKAKSKSFIAWLTGEGFQIESQSEEKSESGTYDIQFFHEDVPALNSITQITTAIVTKASELNGTYRGWEAWVVQAM